MSLTLSRTYGVLACFGALVLISCAELPSGLDGEAPAITTPPHSSGPFDGTLKLGTVPSANEIAVGGTEGFLIRDGVTGATLLEGTGAAATVTYSTQTIPGKTSWRLKIHCGTEAERDALVALAAAKHAPPGRNYPTYTIMVNGCWAVYLGDISRASSWTTRVQFQNTAVIDGLAEKTDQFELVTTVSSVAGFRIVMGSTTKTSPNFIAVEAVSGSVTIDGQALDGRAVVFRNATGSLTAVNEVPMETYLRRVLPLVLPPETYGAAEAQKAQAVAERTRAVYNVGRHAAQGFDFFPGEVQPYGGPEVVHEVSSAAIEATAGVVATYGGELMDTPYHPSSGGWTANSEDVFEPQVAYLRGVVDSDMGHMLEQLTLAGFRAASATKLRTSALAEHAVWSKFNRWAVEWTDAEMAEALSASFGVPVTQVTAIRVVDRGTYGRVRLIEFDTDAGTLVAEKNDIRNKLRYRSLEGEWQPLSSTLFFVFRATDGWHLYGAGLGHGVGMSQIGAVSMAEGGKSFSEILSLYYSGVELEQKY